MATAAHGPTTCPKCSGPAVRIEQSGEPHCANQCDELGPARAKRLELQRLTAEIARLLKPALPEDVGFIRVLADYGAGGMGYASTMERDTINLTGARNVVYWPPAQKGFLGLACDGPLRGAKVGPPADIELRGITCVAEVSAAAVTRWEAAPWGT